MCFIKQKRYIGKRHKNYIIEEFIGEGRYGRCYLAKSDTGCKVIIKQFKHSFFSKGSQKNMFEAVILSKLKDQRVPELLGVINNRSFYGFVLEWKPGKTVKDLLFKDNYKFSDREFFNIGIQLIKIIEYLHENGIVHRDIQIPNVLIDNNMVYLIDFGLARFVDGEQYQYDLDYCYLGDFLLYLLYSSFPDNKKLNNLPWHKELLLTEKQKIFIKRLMGLETVYKSIKDIEIEFTDAFKALIE